MSDSDKTSLSDEITSTAAGEDRKIVETNENPSTTNSPENAAANTQENTSSDETLQDSCRTMFKKISEYLQSELSASLEDYELLRKLNDLTRQKYDEMDNVTKALISRMESINEKYASLEPFLAMIDKVDTSVTNLEQAAYKLDSYSKELEARFKKLEKAAS